MIHIARMMADLQFGRGAGQSIFPDGTTHTLSSTGRLRYLFHGKERIATVRASDGQLTLSLLGAERLHEYLKPPNQRVVAVADAVPFVAKGGNLFARHVATVDPLVRAGEEVLVVDESDRLIATGKAILSPQEMLQIKRGIAVSVRHGIEK
jgi:uncharacterized protein with predicted RNA binding PUA domain